MLIDNRFATDGEYPLTEEKKGRGWLVQRAYDRTLRRDVVLKSVPARDPREVRELAQEEEMLRRTRSKYVVSSFGLLRTPNPAAAARLRTHLVVELFSEDTVQNLLERHGGRLDEDRSLRITVHLLEAFEALNRAGIIHRDLHPKHLSYRDRDHLKLFDLGSSLNGSSPSASLSSGLFSRLLAQPAGTATSALAIRNPHPVGTWETMAPEEFTVGARITPAANVYSAGMFLYRLLTGGYPLAYGNFDWGGRHRTLDDMREAQRDLHLREPVEYPRWLRLRIRICLQRALEKKPSDRYPSPREFGKALEKVLHRL
jgi:serine/threonine protein kinase